MFKCKRKKFILETFFASNSIKIAAIERAIKNISMWKFFFMELLANMICTAGAVTVVVKTQFYSESEKIK